MTEHRVSVLRPSLRRYEDPTRSHDERVVALLDALSTIEVAPPPRAHFRAELRAQLVAVAPRLVAEGELNAALPAADRPKPAPRPQHVPDAPAPAAPAQSPFWRRLRAFPLARPFAVATSVIAVLALLLGGAVWMSQDSLPGDSLYGLKRASERVELAVASNDTQRARDHLDFAATRVEEAQQLLTRSTSSVSGIGVLAGGRVSERTAALIASNLRSADSETRSASRLLGSLAVRSASGGALSPMTSWAPMQLARLKALQAAMPSDQLRDDAGQSWSLVDAAAKRASVLAQKVDCACLGTVRSDSLGPVPCSRCARQQPGAPTNPAPNPAPLGTPGTQPQAPTSTTDPGGPITVPSIVPPSEGGGAASSSQIPLLPLPTITVPTSKPSLPPVAVGSCVNLLDLVKLGKCTPKSP